MKKIVCLITIMVFLFFSLPVSAYPVKVLYNPDGTVSVIHPVPNSKLPTETEEQWLQRVFDKATPAGLDYAYMDSSELPSREKRSAWRGNKKDGLFVDEQALLDGGGANFSSDDLTIGLRDELAVLKVENAQLQDRLAAIESLLNVSHGVSPSK